MIMIIIWIMIIIKILIIIIAWNTSFVPPILVLLKDVLARLLVVPW